MAIALNHGKLNVCRMNGVAVDREILSHFVYARNAKNIHSNFI